MGKWTDKLYVTRTECLSGDFHGARSRQDASLGGEEDGAVDLSCCALTMQPWTVAVGTPEGIVYDKVAIIDWLVGSATDPLTGSPLRASDLIDLQMPSGLFCPITGKSFQARRCRVVCVRTSGHVYDGAVIDELLRMPSSSWHDPCTDAPFRRSDIIQLNPRAIPSRAADEDIVDDWSTPSATIPKMPTPEIAPMKAGPARVTLRFANYGDLHCELPVRPATESAIKAVLSAAREGKFCGGAVYRLLPDSLMQLGRPEQSTVLVASTASPVGSHDARGIIGLVNSRPGRYVPHLYVTFGPCPALDAANLALGRLVAGWNVLERLQNVAVDASTLAPINPIVLVDVIVVDDPFMSA